MKMTQIYVLITLLSFCATAQKRDYRGNDSLIAIRDTLIYSKDSIATLKIELRNESSSDILVIDNDVNSLNAVDPTCLTFDISNQITDPLLMPNKRIQCFVLSPGQTVQLQKSSKTPSRISRATIYLNAFNLNSFPKKVQKQILKKRKEKKSEIRLIDLHEQQEQIGLGDVFVEIKYD